ncbi:MAG TPA: PAS domain S-box protein [Humidesulfovibrio sp.]|uniref:PAS domain S-box protein n=1 Tax=Humidesulfovibrio sp. TaxID=2910988 RepID=UPI002C12F8F7|nr:PAS domain S-box protein [Humidesulfovibrio sp.]HWR04468.1 PAS domain S-box protein [Humidesulfovibrio sp.]
MTPPLDEEDAASKALARENAALRAELERTRARLAASENRTLSLLENAPLAYQSLGAEGRLRAVSRGWQELFGYTRDEVLGQPFRSFIAPGDHALLLDNFTAMKSTGRSTGFECTALRKNGEPFTLNIDGMAECSPDGDFQCTHCLLRDISAQKAAQAVLEQRESFYRAVFDSAALPIAIARNQRLLYANPYMAKALGFESRMQLFGKDISCFVAPHHMEEFTERAKQREQGLGVASQYEIDVLDRFGRIMPTHATVSTINLPDGPATIGFFQDISEQKRIADSLKQSEARFRTLFDQVPSIAVQGYDQNRTVIYWNAASEALYGYRMDEALGRTLDDLIIPPPMRPAVIEHIRAWAEDGVPIPSAELELMRKDGSPVPVFSCHVMQSMGEGRKELYCLDVDLSELHAAKGELTRARDAAEAANKAKSEFLANMSHEIRTPMNGVLGMLQLLLGSSLAGEQREFVELAFQSSRRLLDLLNDILDFSRVESGKLPLVAAPLKLKDLGESVLRVFALNAENRGLTLSLHVDESALRPLVGDEARLRQILFNLVGNAVKFTREGSVRLEIWTRPDPAARGRQRAYFCVSDTGPGIPEDKIPHVFERFTQTDSSQTRKYEGAGLGLAIVKRMVELMGGHIVVDSELDQGVSICVFVPLAPAGDDPARTVLAQDELTAAANVPLSILMAEDDRISQMYMRQQLTRLGHQATIVSNGLEAAETAKNRSFDCILMDVQMPEMDGLEATRAIRDFDTTIGRPPACIIAMTAYALTGDREKFLAAGMDGYISKPVQTPELERALAIAQERKAKKA